MADRIDTIIHATDEASVTQDQVAVKARLKWFNAPKGFGFVNPENNPSVDAFLHITALQKIGVQALGDGAIIQCIVDYGDKGAHVEEVLEIIDEGNLPEGIESCEMSEDHKVGEITHMSGTVKWYKPDQGFGFVIPDDGMKDVFIHKSCLDRNGIEEIIPGQRVKMSFRNVPKGREVVSFEFADDKS